MWQRLTLFVAVAGLLVSLWNAYAIAGLRRSVVAANADGPRLAATGPRGGAVAELLGDGDDHAGRRGRAVQAQGGAGDRPARAIDDPVVKDRLLSALEASQQQREQEAERLRDTIRDEVDAFAQEEGLDDATLDALLNELDQRSIAFADTRADVKDGVLTWQEAKVQLESLRKESDDAVAQILGPARYQRLNQRLFGGRAGAGPGPAPRGALGTGLSGP